MNTEATIKDPVTVDSENSINDFFIEVVKEANERIKRRKDEIKLMAGFAFSSEPTSMLVHRDRPIRDNIKNAIAIANNNIMASIYAQTKSAKYMAELEKNHKYCKELEDKINSQKRSGDRLNNINNDMMQPIENMIKSLSDLSLFYSDFDNFENNKEASEAFYRLKTIIDVVSEQIKNVRDYIDDLSSELE